MDKKIYWSLKIVVGVITIGILFKIVNGTLPLLLMLVDMFKLIDTSPELKLLLICLVIYVNIVVMNTVVNIIFKLQSMMKIDLQTQNPTDSAQRRT